MLYGIAFAFAQVRPVETWSSGSIAAAVLLFAAVVAVVVAWAVRVMTRR